jgi:hypothetical protein
LEGNSPRLKELQITREKISSGFQLAAHDFRPVNLLVDGTESIFFRAMKTFFMTRIMVSAADMIICVTETIVSVADTMIFTTKMIVSATATMIFIRETIISVTVSIVSVAEMIISVTKTMV